MWITILYFLAYACLSGVAGALIAEHRGITRFGGFFCGFALGVFGLAIIVLLPRERTTHTPPSGMAAVSCYRCNAAQNIAGSDIAFTCWQCGTHTVVGGEPKMVGQEYRIGVTCPACDKQLTIAPSTTRFECPGCRSSVNSMVTVL
ncbi:hypothetical protein B5P44_12060 [Mycobacterium sp. CBMA 213]|nr:hypothetical protein [Mycolicibacterium sp. CBMA 213]